MPPSLRLILRGAAYALASVWLSVSVCFVLVRGLPGDAASAQTILAGGTSSALAERRATLGLDQPIWLQYGLYWSGVLRGDLGPSWVTGESVVHILYTRGTQTAILALGGLSVGVLLGGLLGVVGHTGQRAVLFAIDLLVATPIYVTGTVLIMMGVAAGGLGALMTLGLHTAGVVANAVVGGLEQTRHHGYVLTAQAKGLHPNILLWRHRLRPILGDVLPVVSVQAGFLLGGTVITEGLFLQAGLGQALLDAVLRRDYPVLQGGVLYLAGIQAIVVGGTHVLRGLLDPTVSAQEYEWDASDSSS